MYLDTKTPHHKKGKGATLSSLPGEEFCNKKERENMGNRANFLPQNQVVSTNPKKITRIVLVVDRSSSMAFATSQVPIELNKQFDTIKQNAEGEVTITLMHFNDFETTVFENYEPKQLESFKYNFIPSGMTALNDAVNSAIYSLEKTETKDSNTTDDWGYLVVVLTDGEENRSSTSARVIAQKIHEKQSTGHWTFAFMVPKGHKQHLINMYGAFSENIIEWGQTLAEYKDVSTGTRGATVNYLSNRSAGVKAVSTFYKTDLSHFDPAISKLLNVTDQFKAHKVDKEIDITSFWNSKMKFPYNKDDGRAFYQLTKKELIQPNKEILVRDKSTKIIYGGDVRRALKMADGTSGVNMKVEPGNHANYDIFVQSKSPNRKLVRGTEILIRK